jgi:signal transduction histidine kinase
MAGATEARNHGEMVDLLRAHFEAVLRQLPAGVMIEEAPSGRPIVGNEQLAAIWGHRFSSMDRIEWISDRRAFHRDGTPYAPAEWPSARTLATGRAVEGEEMEIERADGSRGTVRASSAPIRDAAGSIVAVVSTFYDITEQRKQELGRRFLSEASSILAGSLDYETTLRNVARLAIPTLGDWCTIDILRDDGDIDRLAVEHLRPEKARFARAIDRRYPSDPQSEVGVARVVRTGVAELIPRVSDELLASLAQDAAHLRLLRSAEMRSAMVAPLRARGRSLGAMVFITAESGRHYTQADLELAKELALRAALAIDNARLYHDSQAANRAKSDFLAVISHELRTPLTAVIGYAELLGLGVPDPLTERQRDQVERISISAAHLLMLIEEILTMISLEAGDTPLDPAEIELQDVLHRAEAIIRPLADAKDLTLHMDSSSVVMITDGERLLQVLVGLLSNAVKFTETGGVRVEVSEQPGSVELRVRDTGVGLSREQIDRIFEPFWQAEHPITRRAGGTGLGLTITMGLVERLGGTVDVRSTVSEGSEFTVHLPRRLADPPVAPPGSAGRA